MFLMIIMKIVPSHGMVIRGRIVNSNSLIEKIDVGNIGEVGGQDVGRDEVALFGGEGLEEERVICRATQHIERERMSNKRCVSSIFLPMVLVEASFRILNHTNYCLQIMGYKYTPLSESWRRNL